MATFNSIIRQSNNALIRSPQSSFASIVRSPFQYSVLPFPQPDAIVAYWESGSGITIGTGVSSWADRIGGVTFAQGTAANQPTYIQFDPNYNNQGSLSFDATDVLSAGDVFDIRTLAGMSVMIFCKITNSPANSASLNKSSAGGSGVAAVAGEYSINIASANMSGSFYDTAARATPNIATVVNAKAELYSLVIDRTNSLLSMAVNGGTAGTVAINSALTDFNNGTAFSIRKNVATLAVLEVLVYNVALSQAELNQIAAALKQKYGQ